MPFCPTCRSEFRSGIKVCPTCDEALVAEEDLPAAMSDEEVLAALSEEEVKGIARGALEGCREVQQTLLEARIPAAIRKVDDVVSEAGHFLILEVVVREEDAERASFLLSSEHAELLSREGLDVGARLEGEIIVEKSEFEDDEEGVPACPACGCTEPLVNGECPECGLYLGDD